MRCDSCVTSATMTVDSSRTRTSRDTERHREKDKHEGEKTMLRGEIVDG